MLFVINKAMVVLGIDLGTTNCCVAVYKESNVDVIINSEGKRTTPSWFATVDDSIIIGESAKDLYSRYPENTVFDVKRFIGGKKNNRHLEMESRYLPYETTVDASGNYMINFNGKRYYPEELSGMLLARLKKDAEEYLGVIVNKAVITVPAYFSQEQRKVTQEAGNLAGLEVLRIINEPTSASLAYGIDKKIRGGNIIVYDIGGGTLDVTLLKLDSGFFEVIASDGDPHLGGEDFNNRMKEYIAALFVKKEILKDYFKNPNKVKHIHNKLGCRNLLDVLKLDISIIKPLIDETYGFEKEFLIKIVDALNFSNGDKTVSKIRKECERVKVELSRNERCTFFIEALYQGIDFKLEMSRVKFEAICNPEFNRCMKPLDSVLGSANIKDEDVDAVVMVGGSSRLCWIKDTLNKRFPNRVNNSINPDETVAIGAAIQGAILDYNDIVKDIVLVDVTSHSIGIEVDGGDMEFMIKKNSPIPTSMTKIFSTCFDNQPCIDLKAYEGESRFTENNKYLGGFSIKNIPARGAGVPKFELTVSIDCNGVLKFNFEESNMNLKGFKILERDCVGLVSSDNVEEIEMEDIMVKRLRREILEYLSTLPKNIDILSITDKERATSVYELMIQCRRLLSISVYQKLKTEYLKIKKSIQEATKQLC